MIDPFDDLYSRFGGVACSVALAELGYETQPANEPERSQAAALVWSYLADPPPADGGI